MLRLIIISVFVLCFSGLSKAALSSGACVNEQNGADAVTSHAALIGGKLVNYTAKAGFIEVDSKDKTAKACIFYTAYTVPSNKPRPLTFAFNGGPGSAAVWLHLGFFGPQRIDMGSDGLKVPALSETLIPNEDSPLDVTDIVLIDPVATGFSYPQGNTADKFFGAKNDYASVATFIRNYLNANNRWLSPKFIVGESYGGIRGALLAHYLQSDMAIGLDGVFFVSPAFSWTPLDFSVPDNLAGYWSFFPNYAVTAWYHGVAAPKYLLLDIDSVYSLAKKFADSVYREALVKGNDLSEEELDAVALAVSEFTGLSKERVKQLNLRISDYNYFFDLFASNHQMVGRLDSRFVGPISGNQADWWMMDPSFVIQFPYAAGINQYLRVDLGFEYAGPYITLGNVNPWPYDSDGVYFNVINDLAHALADNPKLQIMIASGYFDLACPTGSIEYDLAQIPNGKAYASRLKVARYFGGHMMYINPQALKQLKGDFAGFVRAQSVTVATPFAPAM